MKNQTIRVNFIIQRGKANKEGKCPILAQITVNREMKYLGTKQYILPERREYGKTIGLSRDDKHINQVQDEIKHNILETHTALLAEDCLLLCRCSRLHCEEKIPRQRFRSRRKVTSRCLICGLPIMRSRSV